MQCNAIQYNTIQYIIQFTPHWGFSVTNYRHQVPHVSILCILYLHLSILKKIVLLSESVYPNPPSQPSLWEETGVPGENPRFSAER